MVKFDRVLVGKIDLDTVGVAYLLGVTRKDTVEALRGETSQENLLDPSVLCIEVGGSGMVETCCFDHHAEDGPTDSATLQAAKVKYGLCGGCSGPTANPPYCNEGDCNLWFSPGSGWTSKLHQLVDYVNLLDTKGPESLRDRTGGNVEFPTLSDVFAGLLLTERDPVEQLHKGIELLATVIEEGINPFGTVPGFNAYAEAKVENNQQIVLAVKSARWETTVVGRKFAILETEFFGAPGALYGAGAEVVVAFNPTFGQPPVAKFTVAGNGIRVNEALQALNALEEGWGGPPTGTIIGSPRSGSTLTLEQVVEIVRKAC